MVMRLLTAHTRYGYVGPTNFDWCVYRVAVTRNPSWINDGYSLSRTLPRNAIIVGKEASGGRFPCLPSLTLRAFCWHHCPSCSQSYHRNIITNARPIQGRTASYATRRQGERETDAVWDQEKFCYSSGATQPRLSPQIHCEPVWLTDEFALTHQST